MRITCFVVCVVIMPAVMAQVQPVASAVYRWADLKVEKEATRERRAVLRGSTTHLEHLEIHASTVAPGNSPHAPHTHADLEELIIVRAGRLKVTINGKSKVLGPGSMAMAIPGEEHGLENGGDEPVTYFIIRYRSKVPLDTVRGRKAGGSFFVDRASLQEQATEKGSRVNYFDRPTAMATRFEMHVTSLKAGQFSHPPHTHRPEEIILLMAGETSMQIGDQHYPATAGDLVLLGADVPHALTNTGKTTCSYFAFQWQ